ncbi:MAG: hypothetical protein K2Q14_03125 [Gammaproteobacteria bacterium]|nr:hypothetical protein [Gammaproteobacteria bacterium]
MKKHIEAYFPQGLALGANFCNRTVEKKRLQENIQTARSTLIISPRRYGKTSLVIQVLQKMAISYANIDLFSELNEIDVQNRILSAVGDILYSLESTPKKAFAFITDFFSDLSISFSIANAKISMQFSRSQKSPAKTILDVLKKLDEVLISKKKKAVLFFDEFQKISQISPSGTIEGSIRHIAQESSSIVFIFSGSNRHLLHIMFDDRAKPLYKLCDRLILDRIANDEYISFIGEKFKTKWNSPLPINIIASILSLTEQHSYYVNVLCHKLWLEEDFPTENKVEEIWHAYAMEEKSNVLHELDLLSANQSKMLIALAKYSPEMSPLSKEFTSITKFSMSSASQALKVLEKMDYIAKINDNTYYIIDPLIKYIFAINS